MTSVCQSAAGRVPRIPRRNRAQGEFTRSTDQRCKLFSVAYFSEFGGCRSSLVLKVGMVGRAGGSGGKDLYRTQRQRG